MERPEPGMGSKTAVLRAASMMAIFAIAVGAQANSIPFQDNFSTPGTHLDYSAWTTVTGPASFFGRTQLADWVTPGGVGQFVVGFGGAQLALNTFNPTGFSLYGTHGVTLAAFQPTGNTAIEFDTRLQLTSLQPGLVYGIYLYGCDPAICATLHDEIDIELVTNTLQPGGSPLLVQLNRYANEPLGAGNGGLAGLPGGFDPLAAHLWTIRWSLNRIDYLVDGLLLATATDHVPQGAMHVNANVWGPAADWPQAFSAALQPVTSAQQNQKFVGLLSSVRVSQVPVGQDLRFVPITPCRVADTRDAAGPFGGPAIAGGTSRDFTIPGSACGVPSTARAYSVNVAVVPPGPLGFLTLWPAGQTRPLASTLNSDGRIKSNAAIVPAGTGGAVSMYASATTQVILDINGYFVPAADPAALAFFPITPCRIADTRNATAPLGGPSLGAGLARTFPILSSACSLPAAARAYSLNFAVVPRGPLFLTAWPTGQAMPLAASLNAGTSTVTANAAIVPAGASGDIDVFVNGATDLVIDINGYFAPASPVGLSLFGGSPCRVLDTRLPAGSPPITPLSLLGGMCIDLSASACGIAATARAAVLSVSAVPPGILGFLTLWPQGQTQPLVSTLNAQDAAITSNLAIVPVTNGWICLYPSAPTHLILDILGYFGQ